MQISVTTDFVSTGLKTWGSPPLLRDFLAEVDCDAPRFGKSLEYDHVPYAQFFFCDAVGIGGIRSLELDRVTRVSVYFSPRRDSADRPHQAFSGNLTVNGKVIRLPCAEAAFPKSGSLSFVNRIAVGTEISAIYSVRAGFVDCVFFDFRNTADRSH